MSPRALFLSIRFTFVIFVSAATACFFGLAVASGAAAEELEITNVRAPDINCIFDTDCRIVVDDSVATFELPGASGEGRLQSRLSPPGESGTPGEGLTEYSYRIDLRNTVGVLNIPCIRSMRIDFGDVAPLNYDDDPATEDVFVVTAGGLGSVGPARAVKTGRMIEFSFSGLCAGGRPGAGVSSYFFGLASAERPREVTVELDSGSETISVQGRAPEAASAPPARGAVRSCLPQFPDLAIDPYAPVCRCLADAGAREFRCALISPDYFLGFRVPFPVPPRRAFEVDWVFTPMSERATAISVAASPKASYRPVNKKSAVVRLKSPGPWKQSAASQRLLGPKGGKPSPLKFRISAPFMKKDLVIVVAPEDFEEQ